MPTNGAKHALKYGHRHRQIRAVWAERVAAGGVTCVRCGKPIHPRAAWDLGHVPGTVDQYEGALHRACNRDTVGSGERPGTLAACPGTCPWLPTRRDLSGEPCACPQSLSVNRDLCWWYHRA